MNSYKQIKNISNFIFFNYYFIKIKNKYTFYMRYCTYTLHNLKQLKISSEKKFYLKKLVLHIITYKL